MTEIREMTTLGVRLARSDKRLIGIVALSNVAFGSDAQSVNGMLRGVATPH